MGTPDWRVCSLDNEKTVEETVREKPILALGAPLMDEALCTLHAQEAPLRFSKSRSRDRSELARIGSLRLLNK